VGHQGQKEEAMPEAGDHHCGQVEASLAAGQMPNGTRDAEQAVDGDGEQGGDDQITAQDGHGLEERERFGRSSLRKGHLDEEATANGEELLAHAQVDEQAHAQGPLEEGRAQGVQADQSVARAAQAVPARF
jgi:hypothetical protein